MALLGSALCLLGFDGVAQAPQFMWGQTVTTPSITNWWSNFRCTVVDHAGNVFGLAEGRAALTVAGSTTSTRQDCLTQVVIKYDSTGQVLWRKEVLPSNQSVPDYQGVLRQIEVDADGNLFALGAFDGHFRSTPRLIIDGDTLLSDAYIGCFFVLKWSPAGQLLWAKTSRARNRYALDFLHNVMAVSPTGKVFVGGATGGNFYPVYIDDDSAANNMHTSWYLVQMSGATGDVDWIRVPRAYQSGNNFPLELRITRLATDAAGNAYALGFGSGFRVDSVRFPASYRVRHQHLDDTCFWVKFGTDGRLLAGRQLVNNYYSSSGGFTVDAAGNSYLSVGQYACPDTLLFSPVTGAPARSFLIGPRQAIVKLNPVGALEWVKPWASHDYQGTPLATDANGRLYGSASYDTTGVSIDGLTLPAGRADAFVATLDAATGQAQQLLSVGGRRTESVNVLSASPTGQLAVGIESTSDTTLLDQLLVYGRVGRSRVKGVMGRVSSYTNLLRGSVFVDANRNNVQDGTEGGYPFGTVVKVMPGERYFVPSESGLYRAPVQLGSYTVSLATTPLYHTVVNLPPNSTTFTSFGNEAPGRTVALRPIAGKQDLQVFLSSSVADLEAWTPFHLGLSYRNIGTVAIDSGTVTLSYDSLLTYRSSTTVASSHAGTMLTWKFYNLLPGQVRHIGSDFDLGPNAVEGDMLRNTAVLEPRAGDLTPGDNQALVVEPVIDSFDADTTTVSFRHLSPQQVLGGEWLDYTINFRNAGADSVYRVVLRDTLPATLQAVTLDVVGASHAYSWTLAPGGVLVVTLYGARLGGTAGNRPGEEGYVHFRIKPQPNLVVGDLISNRASVYLDDEPPFTTTPAITTIQAVVTGEAVASPNMGVNVWPNPATGQVMVEAWVPQAGPLTLRWWDATGRLVHQEQHTVAAGGWRRQLSLAEMPAGLYLLDLQMPGAHLSRRVVVQEKR